MRTVVGLDAVAAEKVALPTRAARKLADQLTGYASGEEMETEVEQVVLLDDVRQVVGTADTMHLSDIVTGLTELRPALYGSLDAGGAGLAAAHGRRAGQASPRTWQGTPQGVEQGHEARVAGRLHDAPSATQTPARAPCAD